jgi:excinuclease ABC subunit C
MTGQEFKELNFPESPGIYIFRDKENIIQYIGRATSLKDRVKSYFSNDLIATRGPLLVDMVTKANSIDYIETDSVLEAIILESNEIKKHQPYYNTKEKDNRSYNVIVITDEEFPRVCIVRERSISSFKDPIKYQFGPYPQGNLLRDALKIIRKIFPFRDEKSKLKHQESFYKSIGLSPATDSPDAKKEYQRTIRNLILFFQGKKKELIKTLEREMNDFAKEQDFENAQKVRNTLYALNHIQDVSLIKSDKDISANGFRVEAYDVAHMSGQNTVGVMTVVIDGEMAKSEYKKFKLSREANDDVNNLKEILTRRLRHDEWGMPNLIVIDGGISQINAAKEIVKNIPIVSVVKNDSHKPSYFLGDESLVKEYSKSILLANSEAHRFAINYHKLLRKKSFLK